MFKGCYSLPLIFFIYLLLPNGSFGLNETDNSTKRSSSYAITQPKLYHGRTTREISTTRNDDGGHHSSVTLIVPVDSEELILDLLLNEDLVSENHTLQYQEGDQIVNQKPRKEELDLCHYHGSVRGKSNSWAAVSTCHGISGVIFDGAKIRHIEPAGDSGIRAKHFLYDRDDLFSTFRLDEASEEVGFNPDLKSARALDTNQFQHSRKARKASFYKPYLANRHPRYVELVLVADHDVYKANKGNIKRIHRLFIQAANIVNSAYTRVNIHVVLVGVVVWSNKNKMKIVPGDEVQTLRNFGDYRKDHLRYQIHHDNAQLITKHSGGGYGYVGGMCSPKRSVATVLYRADAMILAGRMGHEMGHNLGMDHDADFKKKNIKCYCPDKNCIQSGIGKMRFSSCSLKSLAKWLKSGKDKCLRDKPSRPFSTSCGNGRVERGEQCDCGLVPPTGELGWCNLACDMNTCRLKRTGNQRRRLRDVSQVQENHVTGAVAGYAVAM